MFVDAVAFAVASSLVYVVPEGPMVSGAPLQTIRQDDGPKEASRGRTLARLQNMDAARLRVCLRMELLTMATGGRSLYGLDADERLYEEHRRAASVLLRLWRMLPLMKMMQPIISDSVDRAVAKVKSAGGRRAEHAMTYFFDDLEYRMREYRPELYNAFERVRHLTVGLRRANSSDEASATSTLAANATDATDATNDVEMKKYFAALIFADKMTSSSPAPNEGDVRTAKAVDALARILQYDRMKLLQNIYETALQRAAESVTVSVSAAEMDADAVERAYANVFRKFMEYLEEGFTNNVEVNAKLEKMKVLVGSEDGEDSLREAISAEWST